MGSARRFAAAMPSIRRNTRASSPPTTASPTQPSAAFSRILRAAKPNNSEPDSVTVLRLVSPAVLAIAVAHTRTIMEAPDAQDAEGPLVHGWAVHAAFLLGAHDPAKTAAPIPVCARLKNRSPGPGTATSRPRCRAQPRSVPVDAEASTQRPARCAQ